MNWKCLFSILLVTHSGSLLAANLKNGGFESPYQPAPVSKGSKGIVTGSIADGWRDNSNWADVSVDYGPETRGAHRGTAQRISVQRFQSGAVQLVQTAEVTQGQSYRFRLWVRGTAGHSFQLTVQRAAPPYRTLVSETFSLAAEWKELEAAFLARETAPVLLMIRATRVMTFYVDDAQWEHLNQLNSDAPPKRGNLVTGGSFEAGLSFGWSVRTRGLPAVQFQDPRPMVDDTTAAVGRRSLRAEIHNGVQFNSPRFEANLFRPHVLSAWLKASVANTGVSLEVADTQLRKDVRVGTEWQRFTFQFELPYVRSPYVRFVSWGANKPGHTLWLDGVMVEEGTNAAPKFQLSHPVDFTMTLDRPGKIVSVGEPAEVALSFSAAEDAKAEFGAARLRLDTVDVFGESHTLPEIKLPAKAFRLSEFSDVPLGVFKLRGQVFNASGQKLSAPVEMIWARLPKPRDIDPDRSFFGLHAPLAPDYFRIARAIGHRWVRLHDTSAIAKWPIAEPEPGRWEYYDEAVSAAAASGLRVLGMLDGAPQWTSTKPRKEGYWNVYNIPDKPDALEKWKTYVRNVTGHYRGRIDDWEIWNEPWGNWWLAAGGTPKLYAEFMSAAFQTAHVANPQARILGVDTYGSSEENWTRPVLALSGTRSFDAFSFHDYSDELFGGPLNPALRDARRLVELQKAVGEPKPLWVTEGGLFNPGSFYAPQTGGLSPRLQLAWAVRFDVSYLAAGCKAFFIYSLHTDPPMGELNTMCTEHDRAIRPMLAARAVLASLVDGVGVPQRSEPAPGLDRFDFPAAEGRQVAVLWVYTGASQSVSVPTGTDVLNVLGNPVKVAGGKITVTTEPVYFVRKNKP